jgi:hypothetical protein
LSSFDQKIHPLEKFGIYLGFGQGLDSRHNSSMAGNAGSAADQYYHVCTDGTRGTVADVLHNGQVVAHE